ncbi:hypothetical protein VNI00_010620 [Paramarasmius palmivorus]|uniref:DJ-1/PfpI domain-containing protein n=1 Tax=Paramarasmius palmivorus TaxID=297713 RepID=A0AAW0CIE3_9AGAR
MSENPKGSTPPVNFGVVIYPTFQALDTFGPLDALNILSMSHPMNLSVIAQTLDPVSTKQRDPALNKFNSNFGQSVVPTHSFDNAPPLDVLLIPGGYGTEADDIQPAIDFIQKTYPSLKYIITVCNGSWLAARAGILDGKRATSNKESWDRTKVAGPNVKWVSHARWVVDGNIWTASGVSAGIDATLAFIEEVYGSKAADEIANVMEYDRHRDSSWDPFAEKFNLPKENQQVTRARLGSYKSAVMNDKTTKMANNQKGSLPTNFGVLLYPTFQALDAFGPLDALNILSMSFPINLSIIAQSLDPVSTKHRDPSLNKPNSNFGESIVPTHTFDNAPPLDVLLIPGGYGVRADDIQSAIDFIRRTYPSLKHVITVCTGSWLAARAGILDGKRATSNKRSWAGTKVAGPNVKWVSHARWVVDGNVWTSSGVSAGIDVVLAFIEKEYGASVADEVTNIMEYDRHTDSSWDPFAEKYDLPKENE